MYFSAQEKRCMHILIMSIVHTVAAFLKIHVFLYAKSAFE